VRLRSIHLACLLVGSTGCITIGRTHEGNPIDPARIPGIQVGKTTKAEITEWFGAPFRIDQSDITGMAQSAISRFVGDELTIKLDPALYNDVYLYQQKHTKYFGLFFVIIYNYFSSDARFDRLAVVFDDHDRVAAVGWSPADWSR
jgi:hypothetical protein